MTSGPSRLSALSELCGRLCESLDLDRRIDLTLCWLEQQLGFRHSMLLVPADSPGALVVLASHGYAVGVGSQVRVGEGAIGICAERRRALRLNNVRRDLDLVQAVSQDLNGEIPFPGLPNVQSQLATPALCQGQLWGVLYAEDERAGRFTVEDSELLQIIASLLAPALASDADADADAPPGTAEPAKPSAAPLRVRYYAADGSVFFDDEYVIKSLPGRLLFKLLSERHENGRDEFTKKELRLDPSLQLPALRDNLDTRLILLSRRLAQRFPFARIVAVGRGRFRFELDRPFVLAQTTARYP